MMNQDDFFMNDSTYDPNQNFFNLPNLSSMPTFTNFDHQQNLAFLAQDLLNETKKFDPNVKQDENDDEDEETESDSDEEIAEQNTPVIQPNINNNNNTSTQTKKRKLKTKNGEKKKAKSQYQRKNIK